jgi:GAF domain-containing protein
VQVPVMPQLPTSGEGAAAWPWPAPGLAGLVVFTLDARGRVATWPVAAAGLFGRQGDEVTGCDVCDVLLTSPGQRALARRALADVAAGRVWAATVTGGALGEGQFAMRWEPLPGLDGGVLVIVQPAPRHIPGWLGGSAARIGSTLDLTHTAVELAEAAVPGFADGAVVYAAEHLLAADEPTAPRPGQGAAVRRLAARLNGYPQPATDVLLRPDEVLVLDTGSHGSRAMATAQPVISGGPEPGTAGRGPAGQEIIASYPSCLAMPLVARGAVVGCAVFGRAADSPLFGPADIALAGELASRAAVGIDNARLYHREQRAALALQRGLLPGRPDVPARLEVAHCYLPVGDNVIGGDWYDIVPLSGGRAALIVGDAMGHGPEAAAVMVQLRTAAHTLADLELPPRRILGKLDKMAEAMTTAPFATCMAALHDALCSALARPGATLDAVCEEVTQVMSGHGEDDITLVLARIRAS